MSKNKFYEWEEIKKHNNVNDIWIVMDGIVYDLTKYISDHPGGESVILDNSKKGISIL
jgi:cytochrome b involved in lipid metabolism